MSGERRATHIFGRPSFGYSASGIRGNCDCRQRGEEKGVCGNLEAEFNGLLNTDRDKSHPGTGANPVIVAVTARLADAAAHGHSEQDDRNGGGNEYQEPSLREKL